MTEFSSPTGDLARFAFLLDTDDGTQLFNLDTR